MAGRGFQGTVIRSLGARDHRVVVTGSELLAPNFLRMHLSSTTLFEDAIAGPTSWLRFWFPDPDGGRAEFQRAFTISEAEPASGDFSVDFVLHEPAGPASSWAKRARPGTSIQVTSLGSTKFDVRTDLPAGYLLIGDAASIPAINGILGALPRDVPVELYLEQHDVADLLIPVSSHPLLVQRWVERAGPDSLAAAIEDRDWSDWYAWVAPETGSLKHLRARLKNEFGFPKTEMHAQAYWLEGRAMGTTRDAVNTTTSSVDEAEKSAAAEPLETPEPRTDTHASTGTRSSTAAPTTRSRTWRAQAGSRLLAPLRPKLIAAGIAQGLLTLVQLAPFVLLVELSRLMLEGAPAEHLWAVGLWAVSLMAFGALFSSALIFWLHYVDARFSRDLRTRLLAKLARLPLGWFDNRSSGQIKQLVQDDTLALHYLVTHAVPDAVAAVVAPLAVLAYLFVVDWRLALVLFIPVLVYVFTMYSMIIRSGSKTAQALEWSERMNVEASAFLEGQGVVRVFGGAAASSFRARLGEYIAFLNAWQRPFTGQKTFMDLTTRPSTLLLLIAAFGTLFVTTAGMSPAALLPFLLLGTTFGARLLGVGYGLSGLRGGMLAAKRIQVALDEDELTTADGDRSADANAHPTAWRPDGRVEFDGVGFSYRRGVPVLEGIDLVLEPGTVTALVGPSGSGKSTLASLLARFHEVGAGSIRIDGRDLRSLTADELYSSVGFVFQQTQLVHGTVRENLALAIPDASDEQIEEAARAAFIHERIMRLPDGYDTVLGPDAALSGGERQRLTIARAILADTQVLVLDEATAFADPESEYLVQQALNRLTTGRTVLVIAHRLHTITGVNRIVVLERGRVAETGTHEQLLARRGRYGELWEAGGDAAGTARDESREAAR